MVLVCLMEQQILNKDKGVVGLKEDKAYFNLGTHINLVSDNKKFYPLRMAEKDCQNTIDLFFFMNKMVFPIIH